MDLGAMVCLPKNPNCRICPIVSRCYAYQNDLVGEIPKKKLRKKKRTESKCLLMLVFDGRSSGKDLFLEKRVGQELWGGLWSLPEVELSEDPRAWCERHFTNKVLSIDPWEPIKQPLSNYILYIHPIKIRMDGRFDYRSTTYRPRAVPEPTMNTGCFTLSKTLDSSFGFPVPVNRLINQLTQ
jgi:A/G-specific adenine glycosylase